MKNIFIAILTYKKPLEEVSKFRPAHFDFLDTYYKAGKFIASGRQTSLKGGIIIANNVTEEELKRIALSHQQAKEGKMVKSEEVFKMLRTEYGN